VCSIKILICLIEYLLKGSNFEKSIEYFFTVKTNDQNEMQQDENLCVQLEKAKDSKRIIYRIKRTFSINESSD
jgi:hypothetical protein